MSLWIGLMLGGREAEFAPYVMSCYDYGFDTIYPWELVPEEFKSASKMEGFPLFTQYRYLFEVTFISQGSDITTILTTANQAQDLAYLLGSGGYVPPINFIKITYKGTMVYNL